jgi:membrane protein insertase Oxa1/YidC/SpoIIIJ
MPVLIMVYQGIRMYIYWYSKSTFLWITPSFPFPQFHGANLAQADMPLVLLYTVAMYLSQKLTTMPTADPQQQQTQKMMTIMMPLMFAIFFKGFPAAFLLYWLMLTIFSSAHQYYVLKQPDAVPAAGLALPAASAVPEVGKRPPGVRPKQLPSKKKRR